VITNDSEFARLRRTVETLRRNCDTTAPVLIIRGERNARNQLAYVWSGACFPGVRRISVDLDSFRQPRGVDVTAVLGLLLTTLGAAVPQNPAEFEPTEEHDQHPELLRWRADAYQAAVATQPTVVLIFNADTPPQVRPLAPNDPASTVVVTSQHFLAGLSATQPTAVYEVE
jgi:hypothetical protein